MSVPRLITRVDLEADGLPRQHLLLRVKCVTTLLISLWNGNSESPRIAQAAGSVTAAESLLSGQRSESQGVDCMSPTKGQLSL